MNERAIHISSINRVKIGKKQTRRFYNKIQSCITIRFKF